ncbi:MAG TPA: glycosyltransferase family 39 protein, partial [Halanaerobiales bacterium]|nr:glycosyltransferase family 39 protein [Halanaerobiales bacterium]
MNWMARVREAVKDKRVLALLLLLTAFFIFKAFYSTAFPITGDEAYHWEWSRNPAFGYYDHPPLIGWIIALSTLIGGFIGGSELFWTRLPALLSATAVLIMVYLLLVQSTGKRTPGLYGVVFLMAAPLFSIGANVVTTDQPLIFFSGLTVYLLYQAIFREKEHYWYYAGISLGLAFLSKFISILILPGVLLFLIISAEDRYWFKRKEPYIFALIAALLYLPNLLWNAGHNWITFLFNFNRQVGSTSSLEGLGLYIVGQLGVIGLLLFPCLLTALIKGV